MIAHHYGIIAHILRNTRVKVGHIRADVVEIIRRIVPLQAVTSIQQQDIPLSHGGAETVHIALDRHQARLLPLSPDVWTVKPGSVHITGSDNVKRPLLRTQSGR